MTINANDRLKKPANMPVIISAYGGEEYYYNSAETLIKDCDALGLVHDIAEWIVSENESWAQLCRRKIRYYQEAILKHQAPVMWVDVDSRILNKPHFLENLSCDFGGFLRGFNYLAQFDPDQVSRFFAPSFLYFGYTQASLDFIARMIELEQQFPDISATDDYFLEEAWRSHSEQLDVTVFAPKHIIFAGKKSHPSASLVMGSSGNVKDHLSVVEQHGVKNLSIPRQVHVLKHLTVSARLAGDLNSTSVFAQTALQLDPANQDSVIELTKTFSVKEKAEMTRELMMKFSPLWSGAMPAKRRWVDIELNQGDLSIARQVCEDLLQSSIILDRNFAESRLYRIELEERAKLLGVSKTKRPRLWWMENPYPGNFGDIINPYIIEKLTGLPPLIAPAGLHNLVIGSVIKFARKGTGVWGTGTPRMTDVLAPDADYRAVRGPRTRQLVINSGGAVDEIYGDVGVFMPQIYFPAVAKTHRVGLIRHVAHQNRNLTIENIKEIDIRCVGDRGIERFVRELLSCERVISTSLHGLIVAHAYGIPAEWATFRDRRETISGDETKFFDYFESVGLSPHEPIDLAKYSTLTETVHSTISRVPERPIDLKQLAQVSPFELKGEYK